MFSLEQKELELFITPTTLITLLPYSRSYYSRGESVIFRLINRVDGFISVLNGVLLQVMLSIPLPCNSRSLGPLPSCASLKFLFIKFGRGAAGAAGAAAGGSGGFLAGFMLANL